MNWFFRLLRGIYFHVWALSSQDHKIFFNFIQLYLAATNDIDLESVFSFPILPELTFFSYPDGTIRQNNKSTVFQYLNKDFHSNPPDAIETPTVDGMFILSSST